MNIPKTLIAFLVCLSLPMSLLSQEKLSSLAGNSKLKGGTRIQKSGISVLELPFVDDFSSSSPYPDGQKWTDFNAYINSNLGDDSPGIGVATLDAIDSTGAIYSHASTSGFAADYLTSMPINLDVGGDTTVYLSFYYQPQGLGDAPEARDSLILEFFSPQDSKWHWVWSTPGSANKPFQQVLIPVRGAKYLGNGFRFRFHNIASLADAYDPSLKANADHWHIDYVYLNKNRNYQDSMVNDLVIQRNTGSLLLDYTAIPWLHFKQAGINEVATIFPVNLKNLSSERKFYEPDFIIQDLYGTTQDFKKDLIADEIQSLQELNYDATFNFSFTSDASDSANFLVELNLNPTDNDLIPGNTKVQYNQVFSDYYAYDDGSAEAGYGVTGDGTSNALIAVKYNNFNPGDSIVGAQIFFNKSFENSNRKYFKIALWNDNNGVPGELLYSQEGFRPSFENGLTGFELFLLDSAQVVPGSYFIGIEQVTSDFLNIGFDRNISHRKDIFFRISGDWMNTSFEGSLMIRPVFANKSKKSSVSEFELDPNTTELVIFPNPVRNEINFDWSRENRNARISIVNQTGQLVLQNQLFENKISVENLPAGTYFLILDTPRQRLTRKFIKL